MDTLSIRCYPVAGSSPITPKKCSRWLDCCFLCLLSWLIVVFSVVLVSLQAASSLAFKFPQLAGEGSAGEELVIEDPEKARTGSAHLYISAGAHLCISAGQAKPGRSLGLADHQQTNERPVLQTHNDGS